MQVRISEHRAVRWPPHQDGIEHFNLNYCARHPYSIALGFYTDVFPFICEDGYFRSLAGYFFWLRSVKKYEIFRYVNGLKSYRLFTEVQKELYTYDKVKKMRRAVEARVRQNPILLELMLSINILPFAFYYYKPDPDSYIYKDYTRATLFKTWVRDYEKLRIKLKQEYNIKHEKSALPSGLKPWSNPNSWKV